MLKDVVPNQHKAESGLISRIRTLQYILEEHTAIEKVFGLAKTGLNEKNRRIPVQPGPDNRYTSLQPDGSVNSFSFFYVKGPITHDEDISKANLVLIVYGTAGFGEFVSDEKIHDLLRQHEPAYKVRRTYNEGKDAYADFSGVDTKDRHFYSPHYCYRMEGELVYPSGIECVVPYLVSVANKP